MKTLLTLTAAAMLASSTAIAQEYPAAVNAAIQTLASEGYREIKIQRGPFGTRVKAEGNGIEREILIQFGQIVRDETDRDNDDDFDDGRRDDDDRDDDDDYDDDDYDDDRDDDDDDDDSDDDDDDDDDDSDDDDDDRDDD